MTVSRPCYTPGMDSEGSSGIAGLIVLGLFFGGIYLFVRLILSAIRWLDRH